MKLLLKTGGILLAAALIAGTSLQNVHANTFNPNNLADDGAFDNATSMSVGQINGFLNSFSGSCISPNNGFSAPDPTGYSPTAGYQYGGNVSAGQVIYDAAQAYGLNPQVILSTLQKEEGLVRGDGPYGCSALALSASVGYGCPDGGASYNYSGVDLYSLNGNEVTSVNGTCVNSASKAGFSQQIIHATWLFKFGEQRSEGNVNWAVIKGNWNNSDDPQSCYGGPMTQGNFAVCPNSSTTYYDGYDTIDGTSVHIDTGATAALYWYTPHFSGNQDFDTIFTNWFGAPFGYVSAVPRAVWRLYNGQTHDHFLTASASEANTYIAAGWHNDGIVAYSSDSGTSVYRLWNGNTKQHFYTASQTELQNYLNAGWSNDGAIFTAPSSGQPVWRLFNPQNGDHFITTNTGELETYLRAGWHDDGIAFNYPTNEVNPVWRLYNGQTHDHFLTASASELTTYIDAGWHDDGTILQAEPGGTSVYRLWNGNTKQHFYTASQTELQNYLNAGWSNDGAIFTAATSNATPVYRLHNPQNGDNFITANSGELQAYLNAGWSNQGVAFYTNNILAARRLYQPLTGSHRTVDFIGSLWQTAPQGWYDDGVSYYVSGSYGTPVYELYNQQVNSYFYTASSSELNTYIGAGWQNDGIVFYAPTGGTVAVHRLFNPANQTHILISNAQELTNYVNAGWHDDGIVFYALSTP